MTEVERVLSTNRAGWDRVAPMFHGGTALPEYGPLAPTEDSLGLLDGNTDLCALELGCGSGHSLRYLAERGARELWGLDLSPVQIAFAQETLRPFASRVRLIESPMEVDPGIPTGHFDLVYSIYGLGWTTDLRATMDLVARYLRAGGAFLVSGEHPVYSCLGWNGTQYTVSDSLLPRRSSRARLVEGRTDGDSASYPGHLRRASDPSRSTDRSSGGNAAQSSVGDGGPCRSGALVLCRQGHHDADHVHHQGSKTIHRPRSRRPTSACSRRRPVASGAAAAEAQR
jgi:SAM-dependent methyltransferase